MTASVETFKKLIIADDDEDDQLMLEEIITDYSKLINTVCIPDGKRLMEYLISGTPPDLLILDLNMPYKTGIQCLAEIRADKKLKEIPVVIFSTSKNKSDMDLCYALGAQLFYSKPCDIDTCRDIIHSILEIDWSTFERPKTKDEFARVAIRGKLVQ
jgi:CheY-like chemotaxis protein